MNDHADVASRKKILNGQSEKVKWIFLFFLAAACIAYNNRYFWGQGSDFPILVHDYLDRLFPWKHLGAGVFFHSDKFREFIFPEFLGTGKYINLRLGGAFFALLPPEWAIPATKCTGQMIGFFGMFLLLHSFFCKERRATLWAASFAILYAMLPLFYDQTGFMGPAVLPLLVWALVTVTLHGWTVPRALVICITPFLSLLVYGPAFVLFYMGFFLLWRQWHAKATKQGWQAFALCCVFCLISCYDLILASVGYEGFQTHRKIWSEAVPPLFWGNIPVIFYSHFKELFLNGHYHVPAFHNKIVLPFCCISLFFNIFYRDTERTCKALCTFILAQRITFTLLIINSVIYAFLSIPIVWWTYSTVPIIGTINPRFYWLNQTLWYVCFALSAYTLILCAPSIISRIVSKINIFHRIDTVRLATFLKLFIYIVIALAVILQFYYLDKHKLVSDGDYPVTFRQFFAPSLFERVIATIPDKQKDVKTISFGMHPSVTAFNGFRGVDGYMMSYSLSHHSAFAKAIFPELNKDPKLKKYVWNGGGALLPLSGQRSFWHAPNRRTAKS